jgi:hypothetical protein
MKHSALAARLALGAWFGMGILSLDLPFFFQELPFLLKDGLFWIAIT